MKLPKPQKPTPAQIDAALAALHDHSTGERCIDRVFRAVMNAAPPKY